MDEFPLFTIIYPCFCSNLPFGVYSLHPAFSKQAVASENEQDKLHSVSQRYVYQEPQYATESNEKSKKIGPKGKAQPRQKMTVRLRPRKVLCSNCKGICNENSENVDVSKKRKLDSDDDVQDSSESSNQEKKYLMGSMLIPKLSRLHPNEITNAIKGGSKNTGKISEKSNSKMKSDKVDDSERTTQELAFVSVPESDDCLRPDSKDSDNDPSFSSMFSSARTLKICFGEGEGTVVKIPPLTGDFNEDSGVSCDMAKPAKPDSKAAKKAMKKAKKQAKKHSLVETDPWMSQSPKHVGALSPRNNVSNQPTVDPLEKKHKHRVKHKKKYKAQKKRDENTSKGSESESIDYFSDIKDHCLNQKLSISLRRLSSNSYENKNDQEDLESESDDESEVVPDFPANGQEGIRGRNVHVTPGDVVWGKVVGFPWWPGRVLSVTSASRAHVAWYASTTSSIMPCDSLSPFLEDFKVGKTLHLFYYYLLRFFNVIISPLNLIHSHL